MIDVHAFLDVEVSQPNPAEKVEYAVDIPRNQARRLAITLPLAAWPDDTLEECDRRGRCQEEEEEDDGTFSEDGTGDQSRQEFRLL